jgi:hypothetical protein
LKIPVGGREVVKMGRASLAFRQRVRMKPARMPEELEQALR